MVIGKFPITLLPVTLVPMTSGRGTSSGRSLNLLSSVTYSENIIMPVSTLLSVYQEKHETNSREQEKFENVQFNLGACR